MDFSVVKKSGLYQHEFGELCGVSRVTANLWLHRKTGPHLFIRDKVAQMLDKLRMATDKGALPIPKGTPKARRMELIRKAVTV